MEITLAALFSAVCLHENPKGIRGVHQDGVSHGVAGVTQGCLTDVNQAAGTNYRLSDMDDKALAYAVFVAYTELRCRVKNLYPNMLNRLLVWHGATDKAEQERYVKAVLEKVKDGDK